jgi:hypothetical protein
LEQASHNLEQASQKQAQAANELKQVKQAFDKMEQARQKSMHELKYMMMEITSAMREKVRLDPNYFIQNKTDEPKQLPRLADKATHAENATHSDTTATNDTGMLSPVKSVRGKATQTKMADPVSKPNLLSTHAHKISESQAPSAVPGAGDPDTRWLQTVRNDTADEPIKLAVDKTNQAAAKIPPDKSIRRHQDWLLRESTVNLKPHIQKVTLTSAATRNSPESAEFKWLLRKSAVNLKPFSIYPPTEQNEAVSLVLNENCHAAAKHSSNASIRKEVQWLLRDSTVNLKFQNWNNKENTCHSEQHGTNISCTGVH